MMPSKATSATSRAVGTAVAVRLGIASHVEPTEGRDADCSRRARDGGVIRRLMASTMANPAETVAAPANRADRDHRRCCGGRP
jgi:hypothetical protein